MNRVVGVYRNGKVALDQTRGLAGGNARHLRIQRALTAWTYVLTAHSGKTAPEAIQKWVAWFESLARAEQSERRGAWRRGAERVLVPGGFLSQRLDRALDFRIGHGPDGTAGIASVEIDRSNALAIQDCRRGELF